MPVKPSSNPSTKRSSPSFPFLDSHLVLAPLPERLKPCQLPNSEKSHCPSPGGPIRLQDEVAKSSETSVRTSKGGEHEWNLGVGQMQMEQSPQDEPDGAGEMEPEEDRRETKEKVKEESGASSSAAESTAEPGWL